MKIEDASETNNNSCVLDLVGREIAKILFEAILFNYNFFISIYSVVLDLSL